MTSELPPRLCRSDWLTRSVGAPLHVLPLDIGSGCPHRHAHGGGCTFCPADGARARQLRDTNSLRDQVKAAAGFAVERYRATRFAAYIQAFTGTLAPAAEQRALYTALLDMFPFEALSIGTRPDCLDPDTLELLKELSQRLPVGVELGVQTIHDETLTRINRGHDWACSRDAIRRLKAHGLRVAAHVIIGLPGEEVTHFRATADALAAEPIDAIKLHNLHVLRGTTLADDYASAPFPTYDAATYAELAIDFLRRLPPGLPVLRLMTDSPSRDLIAPRWTMPKGRFIDHVTRQLRLREWAQGDLRDGAAPTLDPMPSPEIIVTRDGSRTFRSNDYHACFHSRRGALTEVRGGLEAADLNARLRHGDVALLDIGFGTGLATSEACADAERLAIGQLHVDALEEDRRILRHALETLAPAPRLRELLTATRSQATHSSIHLHWGDARHTIRNVPPGSVDVILHGGFGPLYNAELWTVDFLGLLRAALNATGVLVTPQHAAPVLSGLIAAGFHLGQGPEGIVTARPHAKGTSPPITPSSRGTPRVRPTIPFRDPTLTATRRGIMRQRQETLTTTTDARDDSVPGSCPSRPGTAG